MSHKQKPTRKNNPPRSPPAGNHPSSTTAKPCIIASPKERVVLGDEEERWCLELPNVVHARGILVVPGNHEAEAQTAMFQRHTTAISRWHCRLRQTRSIGKHSLIDISVPKHFADDGLVEVPDTPALVDGAEVLRSKHAMVPGRLKLDYGREVQVVEPAHGERRLKLQIFKVKSQIIRREGRREQG